MAVRTALLNGNNINLDSDFSKYVESLTSQWVISWFDMTTTSVGVGKAFVKCTRANGETIMVYVENTESIAISGNWYIVIKVPQAMIDDWTNNPADWIGIATVELVETLPSANYMTLWQIVGGVLADVRYFIPKVQQLDTLNTRMTTAEADIEALELLWIPDHLEQSAMVWEKYTSSDKIFKQAEPTASLSSAGYNVWDVAANKQVHIQRIWSWTASNTITLKVKMSGSPTTTLHCDVYAWQKYDVSTTESAWYWTWTALATSSKTYSNFSTSWQEITFTLDNAVWWTKGQLLDIVVYQEWNIVNASNFYVLACNSIQYSEAFRCLGVNWTTRTPSYLMPYCHSDWFEQYLLCKTNTETKTASVDPFATQTLESWTNWRPSNNSTYYLMWSFTNPFYSPWTFNVKSNGAVANSQRNDSRFIIYYSFDWWNTKTQLYYWRYNWDNADLDIPIWKTVEFYIRAEHSSYSWINSNCSVQISSEVTTAKQYKIWDINWFPTEVVQPWHVWKINIFGTISEKSFYNWVKDIQDCIDLIKSPTLSTTATAWNIAPWNFVGYIQIWNYKVPYYK